MGRQKGTQPAPFGAVRKARLALKERAHEILEQYLAVVAAAAAQGDNKLAAESLQWLMEHMPEDEGEGMISGSVDKKQQVIDTKPVGPQIKIGIALGGINQAPKALPEVTVIDNGNTDE